MPQHSARQLPCDHCAVPGGTVGGEAAATAHALAKAGSAAAAQKAETSINAGAGGTTGGGAAAQAHALAKAGGAAAAREETNL